MFIPQSIWNNMEPYGTIMGFDFDPSPTASAQGDAVTAWEAQLPATRRASWSFRVFNLDRRCVCSLGCVASTSGWSSYLSSWDVALFVEVSSFNSIEFQPVTPFCKDFRNIIHNCDLRNAQAYQASSLGCRSQPITSWSHNSPWSFWQNSQITGPFDMFKSSNFLGRSKHRPASKKNIKPSIYYRKL